MTEHSEEVANLLFCAGEQSAARVADRSPKAVSAPWLIIPMAGFGKRFKDAGYTDEKSLILAGGRRLIDWSFDPIPKPWLEKSIGIVRQDQIEHDDLHYAEMASEYFGELIALHGPTQGAACTVLAATVGLPPDDPVAVMNADQWFRLGQREYPGLMLPSGKRVSLVTGLGELHEYAMGAGWDGFILTFPGTGPAWSYAVTNGTNRAVHVIEKKQVSPYATVGFYWWRRAGDLVRSICAMIASGQKTNREFYLAPSFNFLPLSDKHVEIVEVEEFHGLGTPEQVKEFEALLATGWKP